MNRVVCLTFLFISVVAGESLAGAQEVAAPTGLTAAVDQATEHDAGVQSAAARVREAQAGLREAKDRRLPEISADISATRGNDPVYVFGSLLTQGRFGADNFAVDFLNHPGDLTQIRSALRVGVPLFTRFELTTGVQQRTLAREEALEDHAGAIQRLRLEVASLYLQALYDTEVLGIIDGHLASAADELGDAARLKERGVVLGSDYYAALAIAGGLRAWRTQVESDRSATTGRLSVLMGSSVTVVSGRLGDAPYPLPPAPDLLRLALEHRPDARQAHSETRMANLSRAQERRSLWPAVQAFASIETDTNDFSSNPSHRLYGVSAHLPFGDPTFLARETRAHAGAEAARLAETATQDRIRAELAQSYEAYQGVLRGLPLIKDQSEQARQSLRLFRPLYRSGRQSILDVLRAEEAAARSEAAYREALHDLHAGYLRLIATTGQLDDGPVRAVDRALEAQP